MPPKRAPRSLALVPLLFSSFLAPEILVPGSSANRPITAGETHVYRGEAAEAPLLVTVEQRGVDLVIEALGDTEQERLTFNSLSDTWSQEVVLLPAGTGGHRLLIRPRQRLADPGRYVLRIETLPADTADGARRIAALTAMSRGGQLSAGTAEEQSQALAAYREALETWRALHEHRWEAEALEAIAALEHESANYQAATNDFRNDLALWRELGDPRREASVWRSLGHTHYWSGRLAEAREAQESAQAIWQRLGERLEEGATLVDLCHYEQRGGNLSSALACFEKARALLHELGSRSQEERIANGLGGLYDLQGKPDEALDFYQQALALRRASGDRGGEAESLMNIATVYRALGDWQEALRLYGQAREILGTLSERSEKAFLLNNLGFTYDNLGEPQRAQVLLQEALELRRQIGEQNGEATTLNNLGLSWRHLGDLDKALEYHRTALKITLSLGDRSQEATTRLRLGETWLERGDPATALRELDQALAIRRSTGGRRGVIQILQLRGTALAASGRPRDALPILQEVLAERQALHDRPREAEALNALATVERSLGRTADAQAHAEAAVARVEELRTGFVSPDLRAAFLATRHRAYTLVIDLLMDRHAAAPEKGYDREALEVSERARARSLVDALQPTAAGAAPVPPALAERRRSLQRLLSAKAGRQKDDPEARGREIEELLTELDTVDAAIRQLDPRYAAFKEPPPIRTAEIAGLLDPGTLLLEYSLGEERSFLWAVGTGSIRSFPLPSRKEIEDLAHRLHDDLSTVEAGAGRRDEAVEKLGKILLGPIWKDVAGLKRLVIVPDGALHYVPFSALLVPDPGKSWDPPGATKRLLQYLEVVFIPSATTLAIQRERLLLRPSAPHRAMVLADPVFATDDPRLAHPASAGKAAASPEGLLPRFERLAASGDEAQEIAALAPAGEVWTARGLEASRETALSGTLRTYRIIHFATHAIADTRNPELSGLVLSLVDANGQPQDGFLGLPEIYELDLDADLVVLSGCRTALGKEVRGEGLMGLTRGFLYAGVPRVAAGLWRVEDRTTAELMKRFYQALWNDHLPPAAALRQAQLALAASNRRYKAPYSWAGFVLQGDWR